jgi:DNA-binding FadR family transcriptional regulator
LRISIQLTNQQKGVAQANVAEHDAIAQAIINGDVEAARNRSQLLIDEAYELIEKSRRASKRKRRAS